MQVPKNYNINAEVSLPSKETAHAALCHLGCVPVLRGLLVHGGKAGAGDAGSGRWVEQEVRGRRTG